MLAGNDVGTPDAWALGLRIADRAVVSDVETMGVPVQHADGRWYDCRPMLDPREQPDSLVDMAREAIAWGLQRGLLVAHAYVPGLYRVVLERLHPDDRGSSVPPAAPEEAATAGATA